MKNFIRILPGAALVAFITLPLPTQATLGEKADSVATDRKALSAVHRAATVHDGYSVIEFASNAGKVREYLSTDGIVFGIAWDGRLHPDLSQLLGSYAKDYETVLQRTPRQHGVKRQKLATDAIVVEKWGHMRGLRGRAYAPALLPVGVGADAIE